MTQWENVLVMRGLLCTGKVNYTASHQCWCGTEQWTKKSAGEFTCAGSREQEDVLKVCAAGRARFTQDVVPHTLLVLSGHILDCDTLSLKSP